MRPIDNVKITNDLNQMPRGLAAMLLEADQKVLANGRDRLPDARIAAMRAAQYRRAKMRGLAPLWKNTQEMIDDAVVRIGREGLVIADDLISQASVPMPNWLSVMELTSHKVGESRKANRGMVPGSKPDGGGIQDKTSYTIPIYMTWDTFEFNVRELAAAQRIGRPLPTDEVEQATRNVNYALEDAAINGLTEKFGGHSAPGLLDSTNTDTFASNEKWDAAGKTGQEIVNDVLAMRLVLSTDKFYGPYTLYVSTTYGAALQKYFDDGTTTQSITRMQALEQLQFGGRNLRVRVADLLPEDTVVLKQDTSSVVDVIVGQQPVAINPAPEVEFHSEWLVYACIVPRVKSDADSNYGICVGTDS